MSKTTYGSVQDEDANSPTNRTARVSEPLLQSWIYSNGEMSDEPGYQSASLWSKLVFGWFAPLLEVGNEKGQLDPSDMEDLPLPLDCSSQSVTSAFDRCWADEKERVRNIALSRTSKGVKNQRKSQKVEPTLMRCLFWAFGADFMKAGLLKLVHDCCIFVGPQVLHGLVFFLRDADAPLSDGLYLTLAVTVSQLTMSFCLRHYFFRCYLTGLRIRTSVVIAVYRKALVLDASERQVRTVGEITNLMSVDAQRMQDLTTYLHAIWYSFIQIGLSLYFLWKQLGPSCLGGVLVILIMMPVTKYVAQWIGSMQKRLMKAKDERVEINNEVLGSMKVIKLQAWEESFQKRILSLREVELNQLFWYMMGSALSIMLWSSVPLLVSLSTFAAYTLAGNELEVASALTALALFEILRFPLFMLPQVINRIVEASISFDRVGSFLLCKEHEHIEPGDMVTPGVKIENATFVYNSKKPIANAEKEDAWKEQDLLNAKWESTILRSQLADAENRIKDLLRKESKKGGDEVANEQTALMSKMISFNEDPPQENILSLRRIDFESKPGELIAVVGAVGAGKSTLINSILGEVRNVSGNIFVKGELSYFGQSPFILNATVRSNITFGHAADQIDEEKYQRALLTCALSHDLELLPQGDETEIGEKGITLSGGQKARVALARAVYHDADTYLLDDPLAAVDAHVGKFIFEKCIIGELLMRKRTSKDDDNASVNKKRTVILSTNALKYLSNPMVDRIVVLKDGCIHEMGTYSELKASKTSLFSSFLSVLDDNRAYSDDSEFGGSQLSISTSHNSLSALGGTEVPEVARLLSPIMSFFKSPKKSPKRKSVKAESPDVKTQLIKKLDDETEKDSDIIVKGLMTDELKEREVGHVSRKVYVAWAKAAGGTWVGILIISCFGAVEGINVLSKWWLTYWSQHGSSESGEIRFLAVYAAINLAVIITTFIRVVIVMLAGLRASRRLFEELLDVVLRAPMSFFDTTPIGRILNRFSKDMYTIDENLVSTLRSYLSTIFSVISTILVISSITPWFTVCLIPIIIFYVSQQMYFNITYRELKRIDSVIRSPLYALLGETLDGVSTIRAFGAEQSLLHRLVGMLNKQQNAYFLTCTAQCWLAIRLEIIGTFIILFACLSAVLQHGSHGGNAGFAGLAGLAISFSLSVTQSLNWSVRMASDMEANMVAVERVEQYRKIPSEAARALDKDVALGPDWPSLGAIRFENAKLRYRPGLPLVLKGLNLYIPARSKVGICGRTGAGKSSLCLALMRIVELDTGSIKVDGVDIRNVGLSRLRSKIAVIPQDPVLFSGSVRTNLDPFNEFTDERLYEVLGRVGLYLDSAASSSSLSTMSERQTAPVVKSVEDKVFESGNNFSVGQRQLLVFARALLRGANVVIMDEATAAVDADTDARIQRVMRVDFQHATCITVAHRINTIMDSDYILVMDDGRAAEFDTPANLLSRGGMFRDLVNASDEV